MKLLTTVLIAGLLLIAMPATFATAQGQGPCSEDRFDTKPRMGAATVAHKNSNLIECAAHRWSVSGGASKAKSVARCESGLWTWAHTSGTSYYGLFQHGISYWDSRVHHFIKHRWFPHKRLRDIGPYNGRANAIISIRMAHGGGWGPWSCA